MWHIYSTNEALSSNTNSNNNMTVTLMLKVVFWMDFVSAEKHISPMFLLKNIFHQRILWFTLIHCMHGMATYREHDLTG